MNYFYLTLDTTGVSNPTIVINGGATFATAQLIDLTIGCGDSDTTGYQMKIWGNVDLSHDSNIQATESASQWITYNTNKQIKLSSIDGAKTVNLKIRDDVYNESSIVSNSINLDISLPIVSITGGDVAKISKNEGKNICAFTFSCSEDFSEYKVKVVPTTGSSHDTGVLIPTTNGSVNMSGSAGNYQASKPINCSINGADLQTASSADGQKIIKVFCKDQAGQWSI